MDAVVNGYHQQQPQQAQYQQRHQQHQHQQELMYKSGKPSADSVEVEKSNMVMLVSALAAECMCSVV